MSTAPTIPTIPVRTAAATGCAGPIAARAALGGEGPIDLSLAPHIAGSRELLDRFCTHPRHSQEPALVFAVAAAVVERGAAELLQTIGREGGPVDRERHIIAVRTGNFVQQMLNALGTADPAGAVVPPATADRIAEPARAKIAAALGAGQRTVAARLLELLVTLPGVAAEEVALLLDAVLPNLGAQTLTDLAQATVGRPSVWPAIAALASTRLPARDKGALAARWDALLLGAAAQAADTASTAPSRDDAGSASRDETEHAALRTAVYEAAWPGLVGDGGFPTSPPAWKRLVPHLPSVAGELLPAAATRLVEYLVTETQWFAGPALAAVLRGTPPATAAQFPQRLVLRLLRHSHGEVRLQAQQIARWAVAARLGVAVDQDSAERDARENAPAVLRRP